MNKIINYNFVDKIFLVLIISLLFENIPKVMKVTLLGGELGAKLAFYPMLVGMLYTAWVYLKERQTPPNYKVIIRFICLYLVILFISLIWGLFNYQYYDVLLSYPIDKNSKMYIFNNLLLRYGIVDDFKVSFMISFALKGVKSILLDALWYFGGAYLIFVWYKDRAKRAIELLIKGTLISSIIICIYSFFEIAHLSGSLFAKTIISNYFSPILHELATTEWGWPPALWNSGVRFVFSEPSFAGNYLAFLLPILWLGYFYLKKIWIFILMTILSFSICMTNSRTCYAIYVGCLFLTCILIVAYKQRKYFKHTVAVLCATISGFTLYMGYLELPENFLKANQVIEEVNIENKSPSKIIENNLTNLASSNQRSNAVRYGVMKANMRIFFEHPILGVGTSLSTAYAYNKYTADELQLGEIARWNNMYKKEGPLGQNVLKSAFCEYIRRLAETGIIGLTIFLLPFAIVIIMVLKKIMHVKSAETQVSYICILVALIASLVAGFNAGLDIVYCVWVLLGIAFSIAVANETKVKRSQYK